jgi:hypothetical protein
MKSEKEYTITLSDNEIAFISVAIHFFNIDYKTQLEDIKELAESIENKFSLRNICNYIQEKKEL